MTMAGTEGFEPSRTVLETLIVLVKTGKKPNEIGLFCNNLVGFKYDDFATFLY